jgi:hypothetical protein
MKSLKKIRRIIEVSTGMTQCQITPLGRGGKRVIEAYHNKVTYLTKQLSKLGFVVSLDPVPTAAFRRDK